MCVNNLAVEKTERMESRSDQRLIAVSVLFISLISACIQLEQNNCNSKPILSVRISSYDRDVWRAREKRNYLFMGLRRSE